MVTFSQLVSTKYNNQQEKLYMELKPANSQFTTEELDVIHDALVFTISCVGTQEIPQSNRMRVVLAKIAGLIKYTQVALPSLI